MKPNNDPVIEELHAVRRSIAERFGFDVHRISDDARRRQELEGRAAWTPIVLETNGTVREVGAK